MSRHRDVRCMNYSDEYDGYDDVYGHSVEDDYCVSPSAEQFLFDRSKQQNIASFITEPDIVEDNEEIDDFSGLPNCIQAELSELEESKLASCMKTISEIIGDTVPESMLRDKIIKANFDTDMVLARMSDKSSETDLEKTTSKKEHLDHCPGASLEMSNSPTFTIPKLSFKKSQNLIESTVKRTTFSNNLDGFKTLGSENCNTSFSSLADMIASHSRTMPVCATQMPIESDISTQLFVSLADLTAHHLQKSNNLNNYQTPSSSLLSSSNFVIPKLCMTKNKNVNSDKAESTEPSYIENDETMPLIDKTDTGKNNNVNALQNRLSSFHITSENNLQLDTYINAEISSKTLKQIHSTRTPSPDNWFIDLSTALKEAEQLSVDDCPKYSPLLLSNRQLESIVPERSFQSTEILSESCSFPVKGITHIFNLRRLHKVKLLHAKRTASLFGRTLCRTWKLRRPILKCQVQKYRTVIPFDFSTPYSCK